MWLLPVTCRWGGGDRTRLARRGQPSGIVLSNCVSKAIVNTTAVLGLLLLGCAGKTPVETATRPSAAVAGPSTTTEKSISSVDKPAASSRGPSPGGSTATSRQGLSFQLSEMKERTGSEFGLAVPMLLLTIANIGREAIELPQPGIDLIISLRVVLKPVGNESKLETRYATLLRQWTVQLAPFAAGEPIRQGLSPLSLKRDDVPLPVGRYRVAACVPSSTEAPYPSRFTDVYGGFCSNEVLIEVKRRPR